MTGDVVVTEPVLQWSLGEKVPSPPAVADPVKVELSNSPCSRDVKILLVQFTRGCGQHIFYSAIVINVK